MAATGVLKEIEEVNANCTLMVNLQHASTLGTKTDKAPIYDSDGSAKEATKFVRDFKSFEKEADESLVKHKALEFEIEHLLRVVVSQDIMSIVQSNSVVDTSNLQTELDRVDITTKIRRPQPKSNTKNDRVPSASKSSCIKNKEVEVEEHHRHLLLSKNKKHISYECNNVKLDIRNDKFEYVYAMCKQCLITSNHDVCVLNYVNGMNSCNANQSANVSNVANQKKHKPKVWKSKKLGSKERLASPTPSKPRSCLRYSSTGRIFDLKGKIIAFGESECQSDCSNGDNACTSNPREPTIKRNLKLLINIVWKFLGTVCFGNDHVTDEAPKMIKTFLKKIQVLLQAPVIIVRTDNDIKFKNQVLKEYFNSVGIFHQSSSVKTSQQNGVVEERNRTLAEAARTMLIFSHASLFLWAKVIATTCYTQNHSIIHRRFDKTPYELINGRKLYISFLHVIEALCYPKNDHEDIRKLGAKVDIGFLIGYSTNSCAYRVYNRRTKKIIETMNVTFDELSAMALNSAVQNQASKHDF
nr:integrase, catalytic region, zinc finger, CCHC-type, peptidase aspartic, catalytic [Tanacetum cinerariifolium]